MNPSFQHDSKKLNPWKNMTQRVDFFFWTNRNMTQSMNWSLLHNMTPRIEPFKIWLTELNFLKNDSKNWTFFFQYDSKNWTLLLQKKRLIELNMNQKDWTLFEYVSKIVSFSLKYESQNCPFFNMTQRIELFFWKKTQRIKLFLECDWKNWALFLCDPQNWTFFLIVTQRIEFFYKFDKEVNLFTWLKELNLLFFMTQRIELFGMTQRIEPYTSSKKKQTQRIWPFLVWHKELNLFEYYSKNWTFFLLNKYDSMNWTPFFLNMTQGTQPKELDAFWIWLNGLNFFSFWFKELNFWLKELNLLFTWLKELNFFFHDSKNWTFWNVSQRIEPFLILLKELNTLMWSKELNTSFWMWLKELNPTFWMWLKELNIFLLNVTQRFFLKNMSQGIEPFFLWIWLKKIEHFFKIWL